MFLVSSQELQQVALATLIQSRSVFSFYEINILHFKATEVL